MIADTLTALAVYVVVVLTGAAIAVAVWPPR